MENSDRTGLAAERDVSGQLNFDRSDGASQRTVSHMLGEIAWLMTQSPLHKSMFLSDLETLVMPPMLLEQFRVFYGPDSPAAAALYAFVSDETDARLRSGANRLRPDEWKNGDIPWLIELIAPFGAQKEILDDLVDSVFGGKAFHFHTTGPQGRHVETYSKLT